MILILVALVPAPSALCHRVMELLAERGIDVVRPHCASLGPGPRAAISAEAASTVDHSRSTATPTSCSSSTARTSGTCTVPSMSTARWWTCCLAVRGGARPGTRPGRGGTQDHIAEPAPAGARPRSRSQARRRGVYADDRREGGQQRRGAEPDQRLTTFHSVLTSVSAEIVLPSGLEGLAAAVVPFGMAAPRRSAGVSRGVPGTA